MQFRFGIGPRLFLAFGATALTTVAASAIAWFIFEGIGRALTEVTDEGVPAITTALQLTQASSHIAAAAPALDAVTDHRSHDRELAALQQDLADLNKDIADIGIADGELAGGFEQILRLRSNIRTNVLTLDASVQDRMELAERTSKLSRDIVAAHDRFLDTIVPLARGHVLMGERRRLVSEIHTAVTLIVEILTGAAHAGDDVEATHSRFVAEAERLNRLLTQVATDGELKPLAQIANAMLAFGEGDTDIFAARSEQLAAIASARRTLGANRRFQLLLEDEINKIVEAHRAGITKQAREAGSAIQRGKTYLRLMSSLSLIAAVLIAWLYAGHNLTRRLRRLAASMRDLAAGNLEVAVPMGGSDEITSMADAMQVFKDNAIERRRLLEEQSLISLKAQERAEEAARRSERLFVKVFQASPDVVTLTTVSEGRYVDVNEAFLRLTKRERAQVIGHTSLEFDSLRSDLELRGRLIEGLRRDNVAHESLSLPFSDSGEAREYSVSAEIFRFEDQELLLTAYRDITEQRQLQEQSWRSQKLEALGTLAGGIAHDLNNTLVPVLALSKLTAKRLPEGSQERQNLMTVVTASERARDLVKQILAFSRVENGERTIVDMVVALHEAMNMLRASVPATIRIDSTIEPVQRLSANVGQLHQIITNLVTNAAQAIGTSTGTISVKLDSASPDEHGRGKWIHLSIADTGAGMDAATLQRIFEPFFTTKGVGEGTGLGLSVVHGIVTSLGGRIDVSSVPGHGSKFNLYFPAVGDEDTPHRWPDAPAAAVA
jgi:PAS domain S-box-containing protein